MIAPYLQSAVEASLTVCPSAWLAEVDAIRTGAVTVPFSLFIEEDETADCSGQPELAL